MFNLAVPFSSVAVSYTHLLSNSWLAKSKKLVSFNLITSTFLQVLDQLLILSAISLDSVSYTHLDVYKRQILMLILEKILFQIIVLTV